MNLKETPSMFWIFMGILVSIGLTIFVYNFIGLILLGMFLYYSFRPLYYKLENLIKNNSIRAIITISIFIVPFSAILTYTLLILSTDAYSFYLDYIKNNFSSISTFINNSSYISNFSSFPNSNNISNQELFNISVNLIEQGVSSLSIISNTLLNILIVLVIVYYLLKDEEKIVLWCEKIIFDNVKNSEEYFKKIDDDLEGIYFGNMLTIIVVALISIVAFITYNIFVPEIIEVPYPVLMGVLCGVSSILPAVGIKIIYIPLFSFLTVSTYTNNSLELVWGPLLMLGFSSIMIDLIPETFIRPYMSNRNMHLGLVILSYLCGVIIFGWYGLFFGPLILAIIYRFITYIIPNKT